MITSSLVVDSGQQNPSITNNTPLDMDDVLWKMLIELWTPTIYKDGLDAHITDITIEYLNLLYLTNVRLRD